MNIELLQCFNVKLKLKFVIEYKRLSPRYYLSMDAIFGDDCGDDVFCRRCGGCGTTI